ncbi:hypothetical protein NM688_g7816 [Phlebia brevispora]|uniref:Uncharacterized protein n=1 Tax=Phlebia brevispora TaxID=194682 RepID=A0ACC1S0U4_9APHY|nr:hypothetical protein NM688_g7816 [Phlebia brevispora]
MSISALSSTENSPSQSPSLSPTTGRRLSSRRGSVSASDPWGAHSAVNLNPSRSSSSRLTIVRVPQPAEQTDSKLHRRHGSNASLNSNSSKGDGGSRLSFAFSTFTPISTASGGRASPTGSPRLRPASPGGFSGGGANLSRGPSLSRPQPQREKLAPEKLVELARTSCNPRPAGGAAPITSTVSFTPLPDDVYLPFIDRPAEVASMISTPPTAKLFTLLSQTFPPEARASSSANPSARTPSLDSDSTTWTYAELENWFRKVPREEADDASWVRKARACILPRSELIWERIKGALGVPPELDTDESELEEDPLAAYLPPPIPIPGLPLSRGALNTGMLDADVFEPDSPVVPSGPSAAAGRSVDVEVPASPGVSELELSIEPVVAAPPPPPSNVDPTTGSNMTSLHEVREEDEEEQEPEDGNESAGSSQVSSNAEVHGLRISTSASIPSYSPNLDPESLGPGSFGAGKGASPSPVRLDTNEGTYDALTERGPGHPLFPSSFAHLSTGPTLRAIGRAQSVSYPPPPAFTSLRRADSQSAMMARGRNARPEWARGWDAAKHEDAITTSSVSGHE